jgi:hypothetical protein
VVSTATVSGRGTSLVDGSARGGDFYVATRGDISLAIRGDLHMATREDFFMATDTLRSTTSRWGHCKDTEVGIYNPDLSCHLGVSLSLRFSRCDA